MSESKDTTKKKDNNKTKNIIATSILVVISVAFGYLLGSIFGRDYTQDYSKWAGTYTTDRWNIYEHATLILNEDGTCERPKLPKGECTYKVKNGYVYFNGEENSTTAIGESGLVYNTVRFEKLK